MTRSIWKARLIDERRKAVYDDYLKMSQTDSNKSNVTSKLSVKYGISLPTVYSDLKIAGGQANETKRARRTASR